MVFEFERTCVFLSKTEGTREHLAPLACCVHNYCTTSELVTIPSLQLALGLLPSSLRQQSSTREAKSATC